MTESTNTSGSILARMMEIDFGLMDDEASGKQSRDEYARRGAALKKDQIMQKLAANKKLMMVSSVVTGDDLVAIYPEQKEICIKIALPYTNHDRDAAEDIFQGAFFKAFSSLGKSGSNNYMPRKMVKQIQKEDKQVSLTKGAIIIRDPAAWLHTIVRNTAINEYRRRRREADSLAKMKKDLERENPHFESPEVTVIRKDTNAELHNYVNILPEPSSKIINLHYFEGISYEDIAKNLGCEPTTVRIRAMRALGMLRDVLQRKRDVRNGKIGRPRLSRNYGLLDPTDKKAG